MRNLFLLLILSFISLQVMAQIKNPRNILYEWETDTSQHIVELDEITLVVPRNTFPTIDFPKFIGRKQGLEQFFKHEPVIAVEIDGRAKAYPLNMLTMHEISNDTLSGLPILPTYCPLCNASIVYDRRVSISGKEQVLNFEVSGMLRNSDMVMADKQTQSWWQQLTGEAIVGELVGTKLQIIPSTVISVEDFFESYPDGQILSPETGTTSEARYGTNPYENYDEGSPWLKYIDASKIQDRLPPMERVIDIAGTDGYKVYPFSEIKKAGAINDTYDEQEIVIFYKEGTVSVLDEKDIARSRDIGSATAFYRQVDGQSLTFFKKEGQFIDRQTKSTWDITGKVIDGPLKGKKLRAIPHSNHFAFAWFAFHPDSEIYGE